MGLENNCISIPFHWSSSVWAVTIVTLVFIAGGAFYVLSIKWPTAMLWLKYLMMIVFLITVIIGMIYAPIRLEATDKKITLKMVFSSREIPLSEVTKVIRISKSDIDSSIRTFGSGGLFGYLGRFKNDKLGSYNMYATELNNLVLVCTTNKKYVFSCSRSNEFIEYVNLKIKNNN
ncbi:PH domain-containing protein [Proteiniphilum sp. X52]|uniref:PH domain-containing protein n=1 Tax=Proteiniphilum sp. X52 TaxID=2382159 RepID=UPI000F0A948D|nr:PH domain-containing protein [Proteiniphilum sp. X52]RNC64885.1 hypothetical protein D7D25_09710 [Proteiniphilum sp. X52]